MTYVVPTSFLGNSIGKDVSLETFFTDCETCRNFATFSRMNLRWFTACFVFLIFSETTCRKQATVNFRPQPNRKEVEGQGRIFAARVPPGGGEVCGSPRHSWGHAGQRLRFCKLMKITIRVSDHSPRCRIGTRCCFEPSRWRVMPLNQVAAVASKIHMHIPKIQVWRSRFSGSSQNRFS